MSVGTAAERGAHRDCGQISAAQRHFSGLVYCSGYVKAVAQLSLFSAAIVSLEVNRLVTIGVVEGSVT